MQDDIVGSGYVTGLTLKQTFKYTGKAYVLGNASLAAELSQAGVVPVGSGVSHRLLTPQSMSVWSHSYYFLHRRSKNQS